MWGRMLCGGVSHQVDKTIQEIKFVRILQIEIIPIRTPGPVNAPALLISHISSGWVAPRTRYGDEDYEVSNYIQWDM